MNRKIIKKAVPVISAGTILTMVLPLVSCNPVGSVYTGLENPVTPVGSFYTTETREYTDEGEKAAVTEEFTTPDGICSVKITDAYFDITLDEENSTPYEAGRAYGMAINMMYPEYGDSLEPYLFENIKTAFHNIENDYSPVEERMRTLYDSLDSHYREEIEGLAEGMGITKHGIAPDGELSVEELMLAQMVPDSLRPTACSGLSMWGEKTENSDMISVRCLEWNLGSDMSMCKIHTVLHIKNYEKSITIIGFLGLFDVISGINDDGVFLAMLDAGSDQEFVSEGKTCYSFAMRHCLEEYSTARECGEYMVENSKNFTWSHNIMITDGKESYCAEDAVEQLLQSGKGFSSLRDNNTPLMKGISWDSPDSLCIINAFLTEGSYDSMSGIRVNAVRFAKYNEFVKAKDKFDTAAVKDMMTQEIVETDLYGGATVDNIHRDNLTHMIIIDYHSGSVQVAFTGEEGVVDKPVFYEVDNFKHVSFR